MIGAVIWDTGLLSSVPSLLLVGLAIGVAVVNILDIKRPAGFPPGPTPIPFLGNIPKSDQPLWITMGELSKEYGDVFSLKFGAKWYVILNSYQTIKEGMAVRPLALANRPHYYTKEITDLCGALLRAQKKAAKDKNYDFLTDVHVVQVLASSFRGSIGLLTNTYWGLALLAEYPHVQHRIVNEIHDVIGRDRQPSLNDRDAMPYTSYIHTATVMEMLRFGSVAPLGVPRAAHEDVTIGGYNIPEGTTILYNIYSTHFSDVNFAHSDEFNPERFLNSDGSVHASPDKVIPFGMGIRKCLGYVFAQSILFLAFTHLLQGYQLSKLDGQPGNGSLLGQDPKYGGSRWPSPFRLEVTKRD
ncbi:cytochrome P450 2B2-like [Acanthaster planci]|uniref:Cytochrome P450 2B2-like n=1 Tax=Acanthaster planci TaxID=133434 RepID=A0A8B7YX48_ACAPL|nr:cytochrome P450 2B2-like [Acanthaster planci]